MSLFIFFCIRKSSFLQKENRITDFFRIFATNKKRYAYEYSNDE